MSFLKWFLKWCLYLLIASAFLAVIAYGGGLAYEYYGKVTWEPPSEVHGVYLGMSRSDLLFREDKMHCFLEVKDAKWIVTKKGHAFCDDYAWFRRTNSWDDDRIEIWGRIGIDSEEKVSSIQTEKVEFIPFETEEGMISLLGEPDVLAVNADYSKRVYTYLNKLAPSSPAASFRLTNNSLDLYALGSLGWGKVEEGGLGEYYVLGVKLCPSDVCPFDQSGNLKSAFEGGTVLDLM